MNDQSLYLLTEAAERTGLTVEAIRQRIKRGKLDALKGNDGLLRVRLTSADLEAIKDRPATGHFLPTVTSQPVDDDRLIKALQDVAEARGEAAALRERAERAETRAETAEREREEARVRVAAVDGEAVALRQQIKAERDRAVTWLRETEAARDAAKVEMAEWTAGGPFARAVRAFLNRRGRT